MEPSNDQISLDIDLLRSYFPTFFMEELFANVHEGSSNKGVPVQTYAKVNDIRKRRSKYDESNVREIIFFSSN